MVFITATGTEIGKTYVTCQLIESELNQGKKVHAIKPAISGFEYHEDNDTKLILSSLQQEYNEENINKISPLRYKAALAPNIAAKHEGREVIYQEILDFCKQEGKHNDNLFIEGAGGIMSPLSDDKTNLDLIKDLGCKVILVCGNYLGTVSHTLTAIETLNKYNIKIKYIILNETTKTDLDINENKTMIKSFAKGIDIIPLKYKSRLTL